VSGTASAGAIDAAGEGKRGELRFWNEDDME
jgi:hypothetical protein